MNHYKFHLIYVYWEMSQEIAARWPRGLVEVLLWWSPIFPVHLRSEDVAFLV